MAEVKDNYEILFAVYDDETGAAGAVDSLRAMDKANTIDIIDAATLVKDAEGNTTVKQESLPSVKKGLGVGALIGGAIGLLFPPSIIGAAAIGAGLGAGGAKIAKSALENDELKAAAESLEPGSSAFIAVVENTWVKQVQQAIAGYENFAEHTLDAEASGFIGMIGDDSEALLYGSAESEDAAIDFAVAATDDAIAGQATVAAIGEDGSVAVGHVEGVVAAGEEGEVAGAFSETVAVAGADGDLTVSQQTEAVFLEPGSDEGADEATEES